MGLNAVPDGEWYCDYCNNLRLPEERKEEAPAEPLLPRLFARAATPTNLGSQSHSMPVWEVMDRPMTTSSRSHV